jgi:hypothetical protein
MMSVIAIFRQSSVQVSYSTFSFFPRLLFVSLENKCHGNQSGRKGIYLPT